ncbi:hypothetical protein Tco_1044249 [Tanacetum coccineum]|uniref:Uncharacterized protein n=1 Tax=Tanacetum coccineum TaxID=301880 RepID=A0ABQ5GQL2_9ASTR
MVQQLSSWPQMPCGGGDTGKGGDTGSDDSVGGSGGEGMWGSGDDHGESGDGDRVGIARSLATFISEGSDTGV